MNVPLYPLDLVNLPPHFKQNQVGSARQKLKSALLCLLQHPETIADFQSRIIILLTDLGATQQEVRLYFLIKLSIFRLKIHLLLPL